MLEDRDYAQRLWAEECKYQQPHQLLLSSFLLPFRFPPSILTVKELAGSNAQRHQTVHEDIALSKNLSKEEHLSHQVSEQKRRKQLRKV